MKYRQYVVEIEKIEKKHKLGIDQVLLLKIAAAFEVDKMDYQKLKRKFIRESKSPFSSSKSKPIHLNT